MTLEGIAAYGRAWEEGDAEGVRALFTEDAVYRSHPFRPPHLGHDGIRAESARLDLPHGWGA